MYIAATGPVLQKMAGQISDGLLTASITTPEFVKYSRKNMEEGARKVARDPSSLDLGSVIVGSEQYRAAGCTNVMLEIWGDDREEQARLFGEAVLPKFRGK